MSGPDRALDLIRQGYLFISDEAGDEIPGSRRMLGRCQSIEEYRRIWRELELRMGEGCMVRHSADVEA